MKKGKSPAKQVKIDETIEPAFKHSFQKENGNFRMCKEENGEEHEDPMAYCPIHQTLICAECMIEEHRDCSKKLISAKTLDAEIKALSAQVRYRMVNRTNNIDKLKGKFIGIQDATKESIKRLITFGELVMRTVAELVKSHREEEEKSHTKILDDSDKQIKSLDEALKTYQEIVNVCDDLGKKQSDIVELLDSYEELKNYYEEVKNNNDSLYDNCLEEVKRNQKKIEISYKEEAVKGHLENGFKKIFGVGTSTRSDLGDSEYLCSIHPLASSLTLFNLTTMVATTRDLTLNGSPFNVPYDAGSLIQDNRIIITGGSNDLTNSLKSCHEYSMLLGKLIKRPDLHIARTNHSMIEVGGKAYCIGGRDGTNYLTSCEECIISFNALGDGRSYLDLFQWKEIAPLNEAKSGVSLCVCGRFLYAFGGMGFERKNDALAAQKPDIPIMELPAALSTIERLDIGPVVGATWDVIGNMKNLIGYELGCVEGMYKQKQGIYIFGGRNAEDQLIKDTYFLEKADLEKYKDRELEKVAGGDMEMAEEFGNRVPKKVEEGIWVAGKTSLHFMSFNTDGTCKWSCIKARTSYSI